MEPIARHAPPARKATRAPGLAPAPTQWLADEFAIQDYPSLPGSRTSIPHYELLSIDTDVAMSTSLGAAAEVPPAGSPIVARSEPFYLPGSQELRLSSVQLSPNHVRPDFDMTMEDLYPLFDTSAVSDGHLSMISPILACWFSSPRLIGSGFLSLRRILCPSCLHLCSARALLMQRPAPKPRQTTI